MPKTYASGDEVDYSDINAIVQSAGVYATDAGGDDTYSITVTPAPGTYADGDEYTFKPSTGNTGACTLDVNSLGAKSIKKFDSAGAAKVDLLTGDIVAGQPCRVKYDGTDFLLISSQAPRALYACGQTTRSAGSGTGTQNIAHGLGVVPRLIKITAFAISTTNAALTKSVGTATSTSTCTCTYAYQNNNPIGIVQSNVILQTVTSAGSAGWSATISTLDSTTITLNFTAATTPGTLYIQWEAFA